MEDKELEDFKDKWQERIEAHSSSRQPEWRRKIDKKCHSLGELRDEAKSQGDHWIEQGDIWDHSFYWQWGCIDLGIAKEIDEHLAKEYA